MKESYDYIFTGAGCAGLSLLRRMLKHLFFYDKKILVIDREEKKSNDRTWCFWEKQAGFFDDIVYHRWSQFDFYSHEFSARFDLVPYTYKMIRGIDLYNCVLNEAERHHVDFFKGDIDSLQNNDETVVVRSGARSFLGDYVFNSILSNDWKRDALEKRNVYVLLQHFKGWLIEASEVFFDEGIATFMDFRISQEKGTSFIYVLPISKTKALIEYTLFSEETFDQQEYDVELSNYIQTILNIRNYTVAYSEFGVIPMTSFSFSKGDGRIINIGTAGRQTKGSSGYTFQFIQKQSDKIIDALIRGQNPLQSKTLFEKRFNLYDRIFLNVLSNKKMNGEELFSLLFKNNRPQQVLRFLDNETSVTEEIKIMNSFPVKIFLPASIKEIFNV